MLIMRTHQPGISESINGDRKHARSRLGQSRSTSGYALVSLLVFMSLLVLFALAAAPQVQQQAQREREKEAIFRGQQVADAIAYYYTYGPTRGRGLNSLPTSMDQLMEGIPRGTKKLQILRPEAARDPLSSSGEWRLISPTSQDFAHYIAALTTYVGGTPPPPAREFNALASLIPRVTDVLDTKSTSTAPGGEENSDNSSGPFLGVSSRSRRNSVITFYGIDRHDEWIFTPLFH
jgi:type II secretory pathway pseudopilin PulG